MANLSETSISLASLIQLLSPVAVAVIGGASWTIKRIVGKTEASIESLQKDFDEMADRHQRAEERIRKEREDSCKAVNGAIEKAVSELRAAHDRLDQECTACREARTRDHADCIDTYGKFGARLTKVETEHTIHHRGETCLPGK